MTSSSVSTLWPSRWWGAWSNFKKCCRVSRFSLGGWGPRGRQKKAPWLDLSFWSQHLGSSHDLFVVSQREPCSWEWRSRMKYSHRLSFLILLISWLSSLMSVPSQDYCEWGTCSFLLHARLVLLLHISHSWPAPQDTSRIPCCSRTVSLGYPRISGRSRISRVFPESTISCLSTLRFGFNRDRLMNKVPVHCCVCFHPSCVCTVGYTCVCAHLITSGHTHVGGCAYPHCVTAC